jgi:hypothetical protein
MGKETKRKRQFAIRHKLQKKEKIGKLKARYNSADSKERERIFAKIRKLSPDYSIDEMGKA